MTTRMRFQSLSLVVHAGVALSFLVPWTLARIEIPPFEPKTRAIGVDFSPLLPYIHEALKPKEQLRLDQGGGGGGENNPVPASEGRLPRSSMQVPLAPPQVMIQNPNAMMSVEPTLYGSPDIKIRQPDTPNYGDPLATVLTNSSGPGKEGGIGTGSKGGVGSGDNNGYGPGKDGGMGNHSFRAGTGGVGFPECVYCPNPPYTEEARKARFQGPVLLDVMIEADGRVSHVRVINGVGMGLDESALETVRTWRFKPAMGPGHRPVAVTAPVEITFRLF